MKSPDKKKKDIYIAYKNIGETPLEVIERLKKEGNIKENTPVTYAGRLDPVAEGVLVLLTGEEVHNKEEYTKLDKIYEFQILFGFSTDTYDILGRIDDTEDTIFNTPLFEKTLKKFIGKQEQAYPPYSSKTVEGKQLFEWAREGKLHEIEIPVHDIEIKDLTPVKVDMISVVDLKKEIKERVGKVNGDFRQKEILELWDAYIDNTVMSEFPLITCRMNCTSGTYVRTLVYDIGRELNVPTTTFSIKRESVGEFTILPN